MDFSNVTRHNEFMQELDIQSGIDFWDPSENRSWMAVMELLQMDKRTVEFFEWLDDRTCETV